MLDTQFNVVLISISSMIKKFTYTHLGVSNKTMPFEVTNVAYKCDDFKSINTITPSKKIFKSVEKWNTPQDVTITHTNQVTIKELQQLDVYNGYVEPTRGEGFGLTKYVEDEFGNIELLRPKSIAYNECPKFVYKINENILRRIATCDVAKFIKDNKYFTTNKNHKASTSGVLTCVFELLRKMLLDYNTNFDVSEISNNFLKGARQDQSNIIGARALLLKLNLITIKTFKRFNNAQGSQVYEYKPTTLLINLSKQGGFKSITTYLARDIKSKVGKVSDVLRAHPNEVKGIKNNTSNVNEVNETIINSNYGLVNEEMSEQEYKELLKTVKTIHFYSVIAPRIRKKQLRESKNNG